VGTAASFPSTGLYKIAGTTFLIGRDAGGMYAMSSLCTHQQCNLNTKGAIFNGGIHCNCHGAEFDNNGAVTNGPAINPLKHYQLTLECDGNLWVDKAIVVASDQRLMA
jgi:Rieske Fe-S protein